MKNVGIDLVVGLDGFMILKNGIFFIIFKIDIFCVVVIIVSSKIRGIFFSYSGFSSKGYFFW